MIVAILCAHPVLVAEFESQIERLRLSDPGLGALRDTMLMQADRPAGALAEALARENPGVLETLMRHPHVRSAPPVLRRDDSDFARMCLAEELAKLQATRAVRAETEEAAEALEGLADEGVTWRISQATKAFHRAGKSKLEDTGDLGEDRAAMSDFLQSLLDKHGGG
nr:ORF1; Method: conceptual translation supplied by author [Rhodobacter capsulatus SB 1003]